MKFRETLPGHTERPSSGDAEAGLGSLGRRCHQLLTQTLQILEIRLFKTAVEIQQQQTGAKRTQPRWRRQQLRRNSHRARALQTLLHQRQVTADMSIPAVVTADSLHAVVAPPPPAIAISTGTLQSILERFPVSHVNDKSVVAATQNLSRPPVIGGDHRQTRCRSLKQRETERLSQCWIDEQTALSRGPAIDGRNLITAMVLGIGNGAVEVITVNQIKDLLKNLPLLTIHLARVITIAKHQHQVVALPQDRGSTKSFNERRDVFAPICTADGQQRWTLRLPQK